MRSFYRLMPALLAGAMGALATGQAALAQHREGPAFHGDIARFHEHDIEVWRGGAWHHEMHEGRLGWWWVVGGVWYFYPGPIYPYPDPFFPYEPPAVVAVPVTPAPAVPPPPQYWYYCEAAKTYYPYVANCPGGWRTVNPTMPGAGTPPPPAH